MTDWNEPAQVVVWPETEGDELQDRGTVTLREAVRTARAAPRERRIWIIMADGHILRPGEIAALTAELPPEA